MFQFQFKCRHFLLSLLALFKYHYLRPVSMGRCTVIAFKMASTMVADMMKINVHSDFYGLVLTLPV